MAIWNNFVQTTLSSPAAFGDTTIIVAVASGAWNDPPNPGGDISYLTITDSIVAPTMFEIISYTGREGFGPYSLIGCTRGIEGTIARNWSAGAYVIQYITSAQVIDTHELASDNADVVLNGGTF